MNISLNPQQRRNRALASLALITAAAFLAPVTMGPVTLSGLIWVAWAMMPRGGDMTILYVGLTVLGLAADVWTGTTLGYWSLLLLTAHAVMRPNFREDPLTLRLDWLPFAASMAALCILAVGLGSLKTGRWEFATVALDFGLAVAIWPIALWIRRRIKRYLSDPFGPAQPG